MSITVKSSSAPQGPVFGGRMTEAEAAKALGVSSRTLFRLRTQGKGPRYNKLGQKVLYLPQEIEAWLKANESN